MARAGIVEQTAPGAPRALTREEEADRALKRTAISPAGAWAFSLVFLVTILSVPTVQNVVEIRRGLAARRSGAVEERLLPRCWDVIGMLPTLTQLRSMRGPADVLRCLPPVAQIRSFETALERESVVSAWVLPRVQLFLTGVLGAGNEQAYCGRDGWLTYRPEVDYLTGPGFLDPATQRARSLEAEEGSVPPQADPVRAILRFRQQLARRGIALVVVPVPVKPMLHPEKLSARYDTRGRWQDSHSGRAVSQDVLQNPSYDEFRRVLEREGVWAYDPSPLLAEARRRTGKPQYLETDTHWTPEAMVLAARGLARFIQSRVPLPTVPPPGYRRRVSAVTNLGDIAVMLKLPANQRLFRRQQVLVTEIRGPRGELWRPDRNADVLLLGDSFSNIFSLGAMGWGQSAGLAEHLSAALQRPLDCILINAGGSYASRQRLCQQLARGEDRLARKRVVVYQFAMRDLLVGDWKLLDLPDGSAERTDGP